MSLAAQLVRKLFGLARDRSDGSCHWPQGRKDAQTSDDLLLSVAGQIGAPKHACLLMVEEQCACKAEEENNDGLLAYVFVFQVGHIDTQHHLQASAKHH